MTERLVRTTCTHDCPDACSAVVTVDGGGRAIEITADRSHPVTGRHLCVKVDRYLERVYSPDRVLTPLRRTGPKGSGEFTPIGWDEALDEIATRWQQLAAELGATSILGYSYLGSMGLLDAFGTTQALFNRLGATRLERSICGPQWFALSGITGWPWSDPENLPDAKMVVVWGMDPVSTSIHTWELIRRARKQSGAELVVVDPYRSRTTRYADLHLRPNPGTDGALALAVANVIFSEGLEDRRIRGGAHHRCRCLQGRGRIVDAAARCGRDRGCCRETSSTSPAGTPARRPAAIRLGVGMQRSTGSGSALRAIQCLPALTGQWQWPSGGIAGAVSIGHTNLSALSRPDLAPPGTREVNMIQLGRVLTDPTMDPAIRALFVWNSNPAVIAADQQRVLEGLTTRRSVHGRPRPVRHRHGTLRRHRAAGHDDARARRPGRFVGLLVPLLERGGDRPDRRVTIERRGRSAAGCPAGLRRRGVPTRRSPADGAGAGRLARGGGRRDSAEVLRSEGFARVGPPVGTAVASDVDVRVLQRCTRRGRAAPGRRVPPTGPGADAPSSRYPLRLLTLKRHYSINSSYGNLPVMLNAEPVRQRRCTRSTLLPGRSPTARRSACTTTSAASD